MSFNEPPEPGDVVCTTAANINARPTTAQLLDSMRAGIARLHQDAAARALEDMERQLLDETAHPDAPHPDPEWRSRSKRVWRLMRMHLSCEHAPWHHGEIREWAARTNAGVEWLEREVLYWEGRIEVRLSRIRRDLLATKQRKLEGKPVDILELETLDDT